MGGADKPDSGSKGPANEARERIEREFPMERHPRSGGEPPNGSGLEARVAKIEATIEHIATKEQVAGLDGRINVLQERINHLPTKGHTVARCSGDHDFHGGCSCFPGKDSGVRRLGALAVTTLSDDDLERLRPPTSSCGRSAGRGRRGCARAKVLSIGAGGLGSPLLLYLAAAGVGTLASSMTTMCRSPICNARCFTPQPGSAIPRW